MSQPSFVPVSRVAEVRPTLPTPTPEFSRPAKVGLVRTPHLDRGPGRGTPAPSEGFAITLAERALHRCEFERPADRHDAVVGIGLLAAKRASAARRGPILADVTRALSHFAIDLDGPVSAEQSARFRGLAHSWEAQRRFVDSVDIADLEVH